MCSEIQYYCNPFKYNDYQEYLVTATRVGRSQDDLLAYIHLRLGLAKDDSIIPENQGSTVIIRKFRIYEDDNMEVVENLLSIVEDIAKKYQYQKIVASPLSAVRELYLKCGYQEQGRYLMKSVDLPASHYILVVSILMIVYAIALHTLLHHFH